MTDQTYNDESHHTPESRERDARLVGHEPKGETMTDDPKCEPGCISYYGGEKKHHRDCPYYPESLTKLNADRIEALLAERDALRAAQSYTYIGKDGKPVLARDLEDERDALEAENQRWRDVAKWYDGTVEKHVTPTGKPARISDKNGVWHDGPAAEMASKILRGLQDVLRAALKGDSHD